jgi:hypothetical protein
MSNCIGGISSYYDKLTTVDMKDEEKNYSLRYMMANEFFHRSFDIMTPTKTRIQSESSKPRMTAFLNGSVYFPYHHRKDILKHIAYDIETNTTTYWNQIAYDQEGEGMRLVVDVDTDSRVLSSPEVNKIAEVLWETLNDYYTDFKQHPIGIFGSKCGPRMKKNQLSTGLHFVCHVMVSIDQARQVLFGFKLRLLQNSYINMNGLIVDADVYKVTARCVSLRMIYSNKLENCLVCSNITEKRMGCHVCDRQGILVSKMTYEPVLCVTPDGKISKKEYFSKHHSNFYTIIQNHSIWPEVAEKREDYRKPLKDPIYESESAKKDNKRKSCPKSDAETSFKQIKVSDTVYDLVEEEVRKIKWKGEFWWDGISVEKIRVSNGRRSAQIFISGLGSSMCLYAMKDHGGNRVWFSVNRSGSLTLNCNSKVEEYGCKKKDRIRFQLPLTLSNRIFGIENPPGFDLSIKRPIDTDTFDMHKFIQKKPMIASKPKDDGGSSADSLQKQLQRLSTLYNLNV